MSFCRWPRSWRRHNGGACRRHASGQRRVQPRVVTNDAATTLASFTSERWGFDKMTQRVLSVHTFISHSTHGRYMRNVPAMRSDHAISCLKIQCNLTVLRRRRACFATVKNNARPLRLDSLHLLHVAQVVIAFPACFFFPAGRFVVPRVEHVYLAQS